jgi:O-antigen/teichoic acid export membrane protein
LVAAIFTVPLLIRGLGTERYGTLNLAWMLIGYFSLFDFGLSRALIKLVAEKLGTEQQWELPSQVWTALLMMFGLATLGGLIMWLAVPWLVHDILKIPPALQPESMRAFSLLAATLPIIITDAGLSGVLAAHQQFGKINAVAIPMRIFTFVGPLLALGFSRSLVAVTAVLIAGRLVAWIANWSLCFRVVPALRQRPAPTRRVAVRLLQLGGWMTVSIVISPLMVSLDRFLIAALVSVAAVAYYATPYSMITKLWTIPAALVGTLFPAFASDFVQHRDRTARVFEKGSRYLFLCLFPMSLLIVTLAREGLGVWLGAEFASNSTAVPQWLTVGVLINSLAQIPFALIQSAGRADLTAKLHLVELPFYLAAVYWLIEMRGIEGTAMAWTARVAVDACILFAMAARLLPTPGSTTAT